MSKPVGNWSRTCGECWRDTPQLRRWASGQMLCGRCWTGRVHGEVTAQLLDDEFVVFSTHPQHGKVVRGAIRSIGVEARGVRPAMVWKLTGPRQDQDLGVFVGDYADAEARLLDATASQNQLDTAQERLPVPPGATPTAPPEVGHTAISPTVTICLRTPMLVSMSDDTKVCRSCGEPLLRVTVTSLDRGVPVAGYQHAHRPGLGADRGHPADPVDPEAVPADEALDQLITSLRALRRTRSPMARNDQAVELMARSRRVLALVRRAAAQAAVDGGMTQAEYAKRIGTTKGAVYHLLHGELP